MPLPRSGLRGPKTAAFLGPSAGTVSKTCPRAQRPAAGATAPSAGVPPRGGEKGSSEPRYAYRHPPNRGHLSQREPPNVGIQPTFICRRTNPAEAGNPGPMTGNLSTTHAARTMLQYLTGSGAD